MKIPTLLGLALLITAITLGVMLYLNQDNQKQQTIPLYNPQKIQVVNISDTQLSIVWQTSNQVPGQIIYGQSYNLNNLQNDNRDKTEVKQHLVHFVTLKNLKPDTKYYYQIKSGPFTYPDKYLDFKTAKKLNETKDPSLNKPIQGTILNTNLNPVDEALVFLKIEDAQDIATFTSTAGNFIIPLTDLRTTSLETLYKITDKQSAQLLITRAEISSLVDITLPLQTTVLPPLTLGQNINLKNYTGNQVNKTKKQTDLETPEQIAKFDQNKDGKVNSLDQAKVTDLYNSNQFDKKADFNLDSRVDQQDIEIISQALGL